VYAVVIITQVVQKLARIDEYQRGKFVRVFDPFFDQTFTTMEL
jgi:hypothetical protein